MRRIDATLPALGRYSIPFHRESEEVLDFLGEKELRRLDKVHHLGIAAKVFTGVNHSRLEYVLLQCAIVSMLPMFHKGSEHLSIGGKVRIPGQKTPISSCEELLKCWALLGNCGHAQYTYGVERSLLTWACENKSKFDDLIDDFPTPLKVWTREVIAEYKDSEFHYVLCLFRISFLPKRSRLKAKLYRVLGALLLPIEELGISESSELYKLYRLRKLFGQVRLLCIVTLDSYYSHHPIRYQVAGALMNLSVLTDEREGRSGFLELLERTSAWLADEIYLHPSAIASQRYYEVEAAAKLEGAYKARLAGKNEFRQFFPNFMANGFGQPSVGVLENFARLSFPNWDVGAIFGRNEYLIRRAIEDHLRADGATFVSVVKNDFANMVHIDLLYQRTEDDPSAIAKMCTKSAEWIVRLAEAQSLKRVRALLTRKDAIDPGIIERLRARALNESIDRSYFAFKGIFEGIIRYLLPDGYVGVVSEAMPGQSRRHLGFRIAYPRGGGYDSVSEGVEELLERNSKLISMDRVHEIKAVRAVFENSKAPIVMVCFEKFIIRDSYGKDRDEWDGMILELDESDMKFSIIEAKNLSSAAKSENKAFSQLKETRGLLSSKRFSSGRRTRLKGFGAMLRISFC